MTMRDEAWWRGWGKLLLGLTLLTLGCAHGPRAAATSSNDRAVSASPHLSLPSSSSPGSSTPQPLYHHRGARGPGTEAATMQREQVAACATAQDTTPTRAGQPLPPGWPDLSSMNSEALLAPFLACTPSEFIALQDRLDMPRLVERLDDWSAVRLGALGPVREDAAALLNRKRASFLATATREYGPVLAEVFALFVVHSSHDDDLDPMLGTLAREKQLTRTLGDMARVQEHLRQRGLLLANYPERSERPVDSLRGAREGLGTLVSSTPLLQGSGVMAYDEYKRQLPPDYRQALVKVEAALVEEGLASRHTALGVVDEVTFGIPLGTWHLVAGTAQGLSSLSRGQYEQATRELTPATLVVAVYAGGKGLRLLSESRGAGMGGRRGLPVAELRSRLAEVVTELETRLGGQTLDALARHIRARREAARFVAVGGPDAAVALHEAGGNVPRARAWLSQAKSERPGSSRARGSAGKSPGGGASLVDEATGLPQEVVEARLAKAELESTGPRLSSDVTVLEKQRPALDSPPPGVRGHPLWSEYVSYFEQRLADLQQGKKVKRGRKLEAPLQWESYQKMRGLVTRGLVFERDMASALRAEVNIPKAQRRFLQEFDEPLVETFVGVKKPESGLRYADALVIERKPPPGKPPRVETFSFKSRDLAQLGERQLTAQMKADATEALKYYGGTLEIRRPGLESTVKVQRVRLIYEGGKLTPKDPNLLNRAVRKVQEDVPGVEVLFQ